MKALREMVLRVVSQGRKAADLRPFLSSPEQLLDLCAQISGILERGKYVGRADFRALIASLMEARASPFENALGVILLRAYLDQPRRQRNYIFLDGLIGFFRDCARAFCEPVFVGFAAETLATLVRQLPAANRFRLDAEVVHLLGDLSAEEVGFERRVVAAALLTQLVRADSHRVFRLARKSLLALSLRVLSERGSAQARGLELLEEVAAQAGRTEREEQGELIGELFLRVTRALQERKAAAPDVWAGYLALARSVFAHAHPDVFAESYPALASFLVQQVGRGATARGSGSAVLRAYTALLPRLAAYNRAVFAGHDELFLTAVGQLFQNVAQTPDGCEALFDCLTQLLEDGEPPAEVVELALARMCGILREAWQHRARAGPTPAFFHCLRAALVRGWRGLAVPGPRYFLAVNSALLLGFCPATLEIVAFALERCPAEPTLGPKLRLVVGRLLGFDCSAPPAAECANDAALPAEADALFEQDLALFRQKLAEAEAPGAAGFAAQPAIATALEAVARFRLLERPEPRPLLVRNVVLRYLEADAPELRRKAADIAASVARALDARSVQVLADRLLGVVASDADNGVRETALAAVGALCAGFGGQLARSEHVASLVTCLYDRNPAIIREAVVILQRLAPHSPEVLPKLDQLLFGYVTFLGGTAHHFSEQIVVCVDALALFADHAFFLLHDKSLVLVHLLLDVADRCAEHLLAGEGESGASVRVLCALLACARKLLCFHVEAATAVFDRVAALAMRVLRQDTAVLYAPAAHALAAATRFSGLQLVLVFRHDVFGVVFELLRRQLPGESAGALLQLLGVVGAVDPLIVRRAEKLRAKNPDRLAALSNDGLAAVIAKSVRCELNVLELLRGPQHAADRSAHDQLRAFRKHAFGPEQPAEPRAAGGADSRGSRLSAPPACEPADPASIAAASTAEAGREAGAADGGEALADIHGQENLLRYVCAKIFRALFANISDGGEESKPLLLDSLRALVLLLAGENQRFAGLLFPGLLGLLDRAEPPAGPRGAYHAQLFDVLRLAVVFCEEELAKSPGLLEALLGRLVRALAADELQEIALEMCAVLAGQAGVRPRIRELITALLGVLVRDPQTPRAQRVFRVLRRMEAQDLFDLGAGVLFRLVGQAARPGGARASAEVLRGAFELLEHLLYAGADVANHYSLLVRGSIEFLKAAGDAAVAAPARGFLVTLVATQRERCRSYLPLLHPHVAEDEHYRRLVEGLQTLGHFPVLPERQKAAAECEAAEPPPARGVPLAQLLSRPLAWDELAAAFRCSEDFKAEDWESWHHRLRRLLLSESPCAAVAACRRLQYLAHVHNSIAPSAFAVFWNQLDEAQAAEVLQAYDCLLGAARTAPPAMLRSLLLKSELLSHDLHNTFVLDYGRLADAGARCNLLHKAVYFRELEFQQNPSGCVGKLLELYVRVGARESAEGLVEYAQRTLGLPVSIHWLESLGRWHKGLSEYRKHEPSSETLAAQIRCFAALSQWELVLEKVREAAPGDRAAAKALGGYGALAAFQLGEWGELATHAAAAEPGAAQDFFSAVVAVRAGEFDRAERLLEAMRAGVAREAEGLLSYYTAGDAVARLQEIAELEEVLLVERDLRRLARADGAAAEAERAAQVLAGLRQRLNAHWEDRLAATQQSAETLERLIAIRRLSPDADLFRARLALAKQCYAEGNVPLYKKTLRALRLQGEERPVADMLQLEHLACLYKTGEARDAKILEYFNALLQGGGVRREHRYLFFKKVGKWLLHSPERALGPEVVIPLLDESLRLRPEQKSVWHHFAVANARALEAAAEPEALPHFDLYLKNAFAGFVRSIAGAEAHNAKYLVQDLLQLLDLWFRFGDRPAVREEVALAVATVDRRHWLQVVAHIVSRIEEGSAAVRESIKALLLAVARTSPQALVFPLLLARASPVEKRARVAERLLVAMADEHGRLIGEAELFGQELVRVATLFEEQWAGGVREAYRYGVEGGNAPAMETVLDRLFRAAQRPATPSERNFLHRHGHALARARDALEMHRAHGHPVFLAQLWAVLAELSAALDRRLAACTALALEDVSPARLRLRDTLLHVPGTDRKGAEDQRVRIHALRNAVAVLRSKRRPKKLSMVGANGKVYAFLLKGNEDLRQDERAVQLLNMVNDLLKNSAQLDYRGLKVVTYHVLPLSTNTGLISWLEGCDTLYQLVRQHRLAHGVRPDAERALADEFYHDYDALARLQKLEVYHFVLGQTRGEDLKQLLWLRNESCEAWLAQRGNYVRSLAVMSIVGYVLGLGDRHLANLMLQRSTGKVVHIDFGDCFETASRRERCPERVPFRLTRGLVNAMEACGIAGLFQKTCEAAMRLVHAHRQTLEATLEEFVYDPLVTWRLIDGGAEAGSRPVSLSRARAPVDGSPPPNSLRVEGPLEVEQRQRDALARPDRERNQKAEEAIGRIKRKLRGAEFDELEALSSDAQVHRLIAIATACDNICQCYSGWNPFF